jgi:7-cyano-7-deazaguanine synthase in queuosine biosynthesis
MDTIITNLENLIKNNKVIGISISGGLDSTLLAYLLHDIKYKTNSDISLKFFCVPRPDDSIVHARRIVDYIDSQFNQSTSVIHCVGQGDLHHSEQVKSGMREAIQKYDLDILVSAVTKNPEICDPPEYLPNYAYGSFLEKDGTPYNGPVRVKPQNPKFINPFWDNTKADTVRLIKDLNLTEIPKITHTCTGSKTLRCNQCWQCCERAWAFAKNNLIDTGTM